MQLIDVLALSGAATLAVLGALFVFVWRRLRYPSAPWFAAVFLTSAFVNALDAMVPSARTAGYHNALLTERFIVSGLFASGLATLAARSTTVRRSWLAGLLGTLFGGFLATQALEFGDVGVSAVFALVTLEEAVLFAAMARFERGNGHAFVSAALLVVPVSYAVAYFDDLPMALARYQATAPYVLVAMSALVVRMLREHAEALTMLSKKDEAERALLALNQTLDERVASRTLELEEVVRYQESFNRSVAHDLRGPVGAIARYAQLLEESVARQELGSLQRGLPAIARQAENVVRTVNALLRLARANDVKLQLRPVVLEQAVRAAIQDLDLVQSHFAPSKLIRVRPLPTLVADLDLLKQLYVNLLGNAVKFSCAASDAAIEVGCETTPDETLVFFVRDNGLGFAMERAKHLFEPFVRLHGNKYDGTGVGLSICRRIVARHAGHIWAESAPNKGTTFYFTLGQPEPPVDVVRKPWYTEEAVAPEPQAPAPWPVPPRASQRQGAG